MSRSELPPNWRLVKAGDIADYINGYAFKPSDWKSDGLPIIRIQNLNDSKKPYNFFAGQVDSRYFVKKGDILISWSASLDAFMWNGSDAWLNQHIFKAVVDEAAVARDFFYWVMKQEIRRIAESAHGSTMKHVTRKTFLDSAVPLPPLPEQQAIARTLRALQEAKETRQRELELERERKAALMEYLFTHGTRGEARKQTEIGEMPASWRVMKLAAVCNCLDHKRVPVRLSDRNQRPGTIPYYGASGQAGWIDDFLFDEPLLLIAEDGENLETRKLPIAYSIDGKSWVNNHAHVLRITNGDRSFIEYYVNWIDVFPYLSGATRPKLNKAQLLDILLPSPDLAEQNTIAVALRACDAKIVAVKKEMTVLEELLRAMLEELMTGRLSALPLVEHNATASS